MRDTLFCLSTVIVSPLVCTVLLLFAFTKIPLHFHFSSVRFGTLCAWVAVGFHFAFASILALSFDYLSANQFRAVGCRFIASLHLNRLNWQSQLFGSCGHSNNLERDKHSASYLLPHPRPSFVSVLLWPGTVYYHCHVDIWHNGLVEPKTLKPNYVNLSTGYLLVGEGGGAGALLIKAVRLGWGTLLSNFEYAHILLEYKPVNLLDSLHQEMKDYVYIVTKMK